MRTRRCRCSAEPKAAAGRRPWAFLLKLLDDAEAYRPAENDPSRTTDHSS